MRRSACVFLVVVQLAFLATVYVGAGPVTDPKLLSGLLPKDLPAVVPDTSKIDSAALKNVGADKFLSLWFIYVLTGKVLVADQPATILIPKNSGLMKDPSKLSDKEAVSKILLNHVVFGDIIELETIGESGDIYYSLADSELVFSKINDRIVVNGVTLTEDQYDFGHVRVYIVEEAVPFLDPEFFDFLSDLPPELLAVTHKPILPMAIVSETFSEVEIIKPVEPKLTSNLNELEIEVELIPTTPTPSTKTKLIPTTPPTKTKPNKSSFRPTRFDKYRKRLQTETSINKNKISLSKSLVSSDSTKKEDISIHNNELNLAKSLFSSLSNTLVDDVTEPATTAEILEEPITETILTEEQETVTPEPELVATTESYIPVTESILLTLESEAELKPEIFESELEFLGEYLNEEPISSHSTFVESMMAEVDKPNSRASVFVEHFNKNNLGQYLDPDSNYTALIPTNGAFYDYYPIDWGFNPFLVANFTTHTLLNHFMEGDINLQMFNDSVEIQSIAGKIIKVNKYSYGSVMVNGHFLSPEMEVEFPHGRIYYIDEMLFVDYDKVRQLKEEYPWFETSPLIGFPWPNSPFLSYLLKNLEENNNTKIFSHLLKNSDISHLVSRRDDDFNTLAYSAFVPTDNAMMKAFKSEDMAVLQKSDINNFLLEHIVSGYLFQKNFETGFNLNSLKNQILPIKIKDETVFVKDSKITTTQKYIYDLGAVFFIDTPLSNIESTTSDALINPVVHVLEEDVEIVPLGDAQILQKEKQIPQQIIIPVSEEPSVIYEIRTEISYSRQINNGIIEPVTRDVIERARRRHS